jgi:peroxiredoxin family protein
VIGMNERLGVVLFSGTADRLMAAAELISGAAAAGERADVLLMKWGLRAFRRGDTDRQAPADPAYRGSGPAGAVQDDPGWAEVIREAKEIGEVWVHACAGDLAAQGLELDDLDPMVDDVLGSASFLDSTATCRVLFV